MATAEPLGRWVLHRAGIRSVWQYDDAELAFAGGRLLLRGMNGAGKSKALELLLPFLLDGDTRRIDATQRDRTTVRWLMTAGRDEGDHIGYVWLELRLLDADGDESFLTIGAGLKASTRTGKTNAWYFVTDRRVGIDLALDVDREPLSVDKLRAALGEDAVVESSAEHRRRVGRLLFGVHDDGRFTNLLHLLHQLRDPNVGNRVEEGHLAQLLSDALPPLDDRFLDDAAMRLDDLEQVKQQVERAERAAATLTDFLGVYRGYAGRKVRERASVAKESATAHQRAERGVSRLEGAHQGALDAEAAALTQLRRLQDERRDVDAARRAVEASPAYRDHLALVDREKAVAALGKTADAADGARRGSAEAVDRARRERDHAQHALDTDAAAAAGAFAEAARDLGRGGVDAVLLTPVPDRAVGDARDRIASLLLVVERRRDRAGEVRHLATARDQRAVELERAQADEATSEAELDATTAAAAAADEQLDVSIDTWGAAVRTWWRELGGFDAAALDDALGSDPSELLGAVDRDVHGSVEPALATARRDEATAAADLRVAQRARDEAAAALAALLGDTDARPAAPSHRRAQRDPASGRPFYELVDFRPGVSDGEAANVEAALDAAGILDAWVAGDGTVRDAVTGDVVVLSGASGPPDDTDALDEVLVAAPGPGSPVAASTVAEILASIALADGATSIGRDGRWRLGVLAGAHTKDVVEFLGAGARAATRQRRIDAGRAALDAARARLDQAQARADAATRERQRLESIPASIPPAEAVVEAVAERDRCHDEARRARARHQADVEVRIARGAAAARARVELEREAARDGLPATLAELLQTDDALRDADASLREARRALDALGRSIDTVERGDQALNDVAALATKAAEAAAAAASEHAGAVAELEALRAALGSEPERLVATLAEHVRRTNALDNEEIPAAEHVHVEAGKASATTGAELAAARTKVDELAGDATSAASALAAIAAMDGVLAAAADVDVAPDADALLAAIPAGSEVSDSLVLARFDAMEKSLPGGFDAALTEEDGVKLVHVADDRGRRPLAVMAAQVQEQAATARARLAEREREVLERFLLHELVDELRSRLADAGDLVTGANRSLARVHTSHGKGVHLAWQLRDDAPDAAVVVTRLVVDDLRSDQDDNALRTALLALIDAERERDPGAGYDEHLRAALSYRDWFEFRVHVTDTARPGSRPLLTKKLGLSQGEQRVLSYLALFAAAASHYDALRRESPTAPRLLLLDDAFAKVDERTHAELLGHLAELDLDYILTSERLWGCFPNVPSLEIYEAVRDPAVPGVALVHYRWDGSERHLVGV